MEHNPEVCKAEFERIKEDIKDLKAKTDDIAVMREQLRQLTASVNSLIVKIDEMLSKPAKRWDTVISSFISAIVGLVVGYFSIHK